MSEKEARAYEYRVARREFERALGYRLRDGAAAFAITQQDGTVVVTVGRRDNGIGYCGVGSTFAFALADLVKGVGG